MLVSIGNTVHKQENLILKTIKVDSLMAPIVSWFNSFSEVYTFSSCEGEIGKPWVAWFSLDQVETIRIMELFNSREETLVRFSPFKGIITYQTIWPDIEYLQNRMTFYEAYN